jgi:hypothetical protein
MIQPEPNQTPPRRNPIKPLISVTEHACTHGAAASTNSCTSHLLHLSHLPYLSYLNYLPHLL